MASRLTTTASFKTYSRLSSSGSKSRQSSSRADLVLTGVMVVVVMIHAGLVLCRYCNRGALSTGEMVEEAIPAWENEVSKKGYNFVFVITRSFKVARHSMLWMDTYTNICPFSETASDCSRELHGNAREDRLNRPIEATFL